jgi:tetratricopeptide (TPR) repeat protein
MFDEAVAEFQKAISLSGNLTCTAAGLGHVYALAGEKQKAGEVIADLDQRARTEYVSSYDTAIVHAGLGQVDEAFDRLGKAYEEHSSWLAYLAVEPRLDSLRSDARFGRLLARVDLA